MQLTQENALITSLKELVNDYLKKNPNLTLHALASRSNVSTSSLRRLVLGGPKFEIAPHSVLNLVSYILREKNISRLISRIDQSIGDFLKKHFGSFIFSVDHQSKSFDPDKYFKDQTKFLIYRLGLNNSGIELKNIERYLGEIGVKKLDEMMSDGLVEMRGKLIFSKQIDYQPTQEMLKEHLPALFQMYQTETSQYRMNQLSFFSESLSLEAVIKINETRERYLNEISQITSNRENFGEIPCFFFSLSGSIV